MITSDEPTLEVNIALLGSRILAANSVLRVEVRVDEGILLQATFDGNKSLSPFLMCLSGAP